MTSAANDSTAAEATGDPASNPEDYRMTIGEHLEELRRRIIRALLGFGIACAICFLFGKKVVEIFCRPLTGKLLQHGLSPNLYTTELTDGFMTYVRISLISAAALSAPWMVYQIWQFVAAGLYPKERKYVTKYVPWSMGLLIAGMVFLYILVLPMILEFFLSFTLGFSLPTSPTLATTMPTLMTIPMVAGDPTPSSLVEGNFWLDTATSQIKVYVNSQIRSLPFTTEGVQPIYTLSEYIDLVLQLLIIFGLAFQLPLVVMAVVSFGLVDIPTLKYFRRHVWFGLIVAAAVVVPGDVVTAMVALFVPMIALFELGIILAGWNKPIETVES